MKTKLLFLLLVISIILLFLGCAQSNGSGAVQGTGQETAASACKKLCESELAKGTGLSNGPCIGNPMNDFPDYVCDIAHSPRAAVDNQQENQCSAFGEGNARHFVEYTPECSFIKEE